MGELITIKDIDQQIMELKVLRRELYLKEIAEFKERAAANVGRCFIIDGRYAKVLDVPQEEHTKTRIDFNKYQYPALFLTSDTRELVPFYEDTIFSGYWGDGHDPLHSSVQEISKEDFEKEYHRLLQKFQEKIGVA